MEEKRTINTTLAIIRDGEKILLGTKKRGFCKDTINAFGGKQDPGESIAQAMVRETYEEVGIMPTKFEWTGFIKFDTNYKGERVFLDMYVYNVTEFEGRAVETEEMLPQWYSLDEIPFEKMLGVDKIWLPKVLAGKCVIGNVEYSDDMAVNPVCDFNIMDRDEFLANDLAL